MAFTFGYIRFKYPPWYQCFSVMSVISFATSNRGEEVPLSTNANAEVAITACKMSFGNLLFYTGRNASTATQQSFMSMTHPSQNITPPHGKCCQFSYKCSNLVKYCR